MARIILPQNIIDESERLFNEYMAQKEGPFSHDDMITYIKEHGSEELIKFQLSEGRELIK